MKKYSKFILLFFCLIVSINQSSLAQKKLETETDTKKSHTIGEITFKYSDQFTLNKPDVKRADTVTFFDNRYPDIEGFIFVTAPITTKGRVANPIFREKLRDDLAKAWVKGDAPKFKWIKRGPGELTNRISKYQIESKGYLGWNGEVYLYIDFRTVKYKNQHFLIGLFTEQGRGKEFEESFKNGILEFYQIHLELLIAKITSSVTNEPEPAGWPPGSIKGNPIDGGFIPPKEGPPQKRN